MTAKGATGQDMGCGGVGNLCFEPIEVEPKETWSYSGGRGMYTYQQPPAMYYTAAAAPQRQGLKLGYAFWCQLLICLGFLAIVGFLIYWFVFVIGGVKFAGTQTVVVLPSTSSEPYDCQAGYWNWERGWSTPKMHWCCDHYGKGCPVMTTSLPFDCEAGYSNWRHGWSQRKKEWCCSRESRGCPDYTTRAPYDCYVGDVRHWSIGKRAWCCDSYQVGCNLPNSDPYDCDAGFHNWEKGWSDAKKAWCCEHANRGCPPAPPAYDCDAGFSNWQKGWSDAKKHWCCSRQNRGCHVHLARPVHSCKLWGDPHIVTFDRSHMVFYSEGDFWIVKSDDAEIQGRFEATQWTKDNDHTDYSSMTSIIVSGEFIHHHKIEVQSMEGRIACNGHSILHGFGEAHCGPATITFNDHGELVDDAMSFLAHKVVHISLPGGDYIQVNRWPNFINAEIVMKPSRHGQDGVCGNFNGDYADDSGEELHRRFGHGVAPHEDLFSDHLKLHVPKAKPSPKRCDEKEIHHAYHVCKHKTFDMVHWSFPECMGDMCDRNKGSWQADALRKHYHPQEHA